MSLGGSERLPTHLFEAGTLGLSAFDVFGKLVLAGLHALLHTEDHEPHLLDVGLSGFDAGLVAGCLLGGRGARGLARVG